MITIELEFVPISANKMYSNNNAYTFPKNGGGKVRGRSKTVEYISWINNAGTEIMMQRPQWPMKAMPEYFSCEVAWPFHPMRDLDNYWKPLFDLLQDMGIIKNDRYCIKQSAYKSTALKRGIVILKPMTKEEAQQEIIDRIMVDAKQFYKGY